MHGAIQAAAAAFAECLDGNPMARGVDLDTAEEAFTLDAPEWPEFHTEFMRLLEVRRALIRVLEASGITASSCDAAIHTAAKAGGFTWEDGRMWRALQREEETGCGCDGSCNSCALDRHNERRANLQDYLARNA